MAMDIVGFRVSSELAMFRRWYTTTSSVSYYFPPPTSVAGMIGAIMGISKEDLWKKFEGSISIVIENPVKVIQQGVNYTNTKGGKTSSFRIRVLHHYLYNPSYLIFYKGPLSSKLLDFMQKKETKYPVYLGHAYNLATVEPINIEKTYELENNYADSVIVNHINRIDWEKNNHIFIEKMDTRMDINRIPIETKSIAYSFDVKTGKPLNIWLIEKQPLTYVKISLLNNKRINESKELWIDWLRI